VRPGLPRLVFFWDLFLSVLTQAFPLGQAKKSPWLASSRVCRKKDRLGVVWLLKSESAPTLPSLRR